MKCLLSQELYLCMYAYESSLVAQTVKRLPAIWETQVQSLGWEDPLEKGNGYPLQYSCLENSVYRRLVGYMGLQRVQHG